MQPMEVRVLPIGATYTTLAQLDLEHQATNLGVGRSNRSCGTTYKETVMAIFVVLVIFVVLYFFIRKI